MFTESKLLDRKLLRHGHTVDQTLLWLLVLMLGFSLVMVYSASVAYAGQDGSKWFYLQRQAAYIGAGAVLAWVAFRRPLGFWRRHSLLILLLSLVLLLVVLVVGREINGAKRWIHIGPANIQPTEIFKLAVILYLSGFFMRRSDVLTKLSKVWFAAIPVAVGLTLIMFQPDFGSFVVVAVIMTGMIFLAGLSMRWFALVMAGGLSAMVMMVALVPYRMARVTAFLDPWQDPLGKGYQLTHSLMAIGRGGWTGVGLGASLEKRFYLPEAHTDFILAVIGEEFGFIGMMVLTACYVWLVWRAFSIGKMARDAEQFFGAYVAKGVGIWIGIQSFFNIGVNIGLLPTKGLTLPLMSYGGSALIMTLVAFALLLRVDYETRRVMRGFKV
ncbi:MAG: putative lipid II flippase FtsW [Eikenella sp.]|nr:putative lipid II flippase FtsW [Eikenella sp.]MDO4695033.1 putative lipid II flippase FtsW [Eikenella sp.]